MNHKKNHSIDQNTWPVPNSARIMNHYLHVVVGDRSRRL
jgi:hypothetical protein